ncbi:hypothetical protein LCGC14_1926150, partial [marine sediment metagenome]
MKAFRQLVSAVPIWLIVAVVVGMIGAACLAQP